MKLEILQGDCLEVLKTLPDESVNCCVTSPPYWGLRDYGCAGQLGLERTPELYVAKMVEVFREVRRVLRSDGTLWLNLGDSYAGSGCGWSNNPESKQYTNRHWSEDEKTKEFSKSKRIERGTGRWGGGNNPAVNCKPKDLVGVPWLTAFALRTEGWYLRSDIIWSKPNPMPESVTDRPTKAHEYIFLMSKSARYYYAADEISEEFVTDIPEENRNPRDERYATNGRLTPLSATPRTFYGEDGRRNKRTVWEVSTKPFSEAHFATFPPDLIEPCIKAGCPEGGTVLDPFSGAGTTGLVSARFGRNYIGIELNPAYVEMSRKRIEQDAPMFNRIETKVSAENSQESQSQIFGGLRT